MEGYTLTQAQCDHCQMPLMELSGNSECVVCPLVSKKAKKRADLRRKGQAIMETFSSDSPPKRLHDPRKQLNEGYLAVEHGSEARGPFEERAQEQEDTQDLLINWEEEQLVQETLKRINSPRKQLQEQLNDQLNEGYLVVEHSPEAEAWEPFEESKERAQGHEEIPGLLINWEEEQLVLEALEPPGDQTWSPRDDGSGGAVIYPEEDVHDTIPFGQFEEECRDEFDSQASESDCEM